MEEEKKETQLFKHESYTDGNLIYIDVMTPVSISSSGKTSIEKEKTKQFIGKTQVNFNGKIMPHTFMIEKAKNIKDALNLFDSSLEESLEDIRKKVEEMQKEEESKILVPDQNIKT